MWPKSRACCPYSGDRDSLSQLDVPDGRPRAANTDTLGNVTAECTFPDAIALPVPVTFESGLLQVILFDDDKGSNDDALGAADIPIKYIAGEPFVVDKAVLKGQPQPGAAGYCFPDSEISFSIEFKGAFA